MRFEPRGLRPRVRVKEIPMGEIAQPTVLEPPKLQLNGIVSPTGFQRFPRETNGHLNGTATVGLNDEKPLVNVGGKGYTASEIYAEFGPNLHKYTSYRVHGNQQIAEDLAADIMLQVLEKAHTYQDLGLPLGAWVFKIAHNKVIDHYKREDRRPATSIDLYKESPFPSESAESALRRTLVAIDIDQAMEQLTPDQQAVLALRFLEGRSLLEVAEMMGRKEKTIKKLQERALNNMRKLMKGFNETS